MSSNPPNSGAAGGDAIALLGSCPLPISDHQEIVLAHGSGGKLTQQLINKVILPSFRNELLEPLHDGAIFSLNGTRIAFSTDSYVVKPIFFPGGDIGKLAVHGTVNDLAMCGARPLYLSVAFILEEGLRMDDFWRIVQSMKASRDPGRSAIGHGRHQGRGPWQGRSDFHQHVRCGLGPRGRANPSPTRRTGRQDPDQRVHCCPRHCHHVRARRTGIRDARSPVTPRRSMAWSKRSSAWPPDIHVLRDPTRGGVTSALNEIAEQARVGIRLEETQIPLSEPVQGACEILGLDPLYVANEGKLLAIVPARRLRSRLVRDDSPSSGPRRCDHRRSCCGPSWTGDDENSRRRRTRRGYAQRRATAAHLLRIRAGRISPCRDSIIPLGQRFESFALGWRQPIQT